MSHLYVLAAMVLIGVIGVLKGLQDAKDSKKLVDKMVFASSADKDSVKKALKVRDDQYIFVSLVLLVGAGVVLYIDRKHRV